MEILFVIQINQDGSTSQEFVLIELLPDIQETKDQEAASFLGGRNSCRG